LTARPSGAKASLLSGLIGTALSRALPKRILKYGRTVRGLAHPLTAWTLPPTLTGMEVHFTPEQEAQLSRIASRAGTDTERLVKDAVLRLLEQDARFRAAVREGIAQADRGEFIEEEEMDARIERMLNS